MAIYKQGICCVQAGAFDEAASHFAKVLKNQTVLSTERLQHLRRFHACALYEAGKHHFGEGDFGKAKKQFATAQKCKSLPKKLEAKTKTYLTQTRTRVRSLRKSSTLEGKTMALLDNSDEDVKHALDLYRKAKTARE